MCLFPEENQQPVLGGHRFSEEKCSFSLALNQQQHTFYKGKSMKKSAEVNPSKNYCSLKQLNNQPTNQPTSQHTTNQDTTNQDTTNQDTHNQDTHNQHTTNTQPTHKQHTTTQTTTRSHLAQASVQDSVLVCLVFVFLIRDGVERLPRVEIR